MLQTVEAMIDAHGRVRLLEDVKINRKRRALVTILPEDFESAREKPLAGSIEIIDEDLESASRAIAEMFDQSINQSAERLGD